MTSNLDHAVLADQGWAERLSVHTASSFPMLSYAGGSERWATTTDCLSQAIEMGVGPPSHSNTVVYLRIDISAICGSGAKDTS
jgi:hypothetical protein